jgi:hypothetical protein
MNFGLAVELKFTAPGLDGEQARAHGAHSQDLPVVQGDRG